MAPKPQLVNDPNTFIPPAVRRHAAAAEAAFRASKGEAPEQPPGAGEAPPPLSTAAQQQPPGAGEAPVTFPEVTPAGNPTASYAAARARSASGGKLGTPLQINGGPVQTRRKRCLEHVCADCIDAEFDRVDAAAGDARDTCRVTSAEPAYAGRSQRVRAGIFGRGRAPRQGRTHSGSRLRCEASSPIWKSSLKAPPSRTPPRRHQIWKRGWIAACRSGAIST